MWECQFEEAGMGIEYTDQKVCNFGMFDDN